MRNWVPHRHTLHWELVVLHLGWGKQATSTANIESSNLFWGGPFLLVRFQKTCFYDSMYNFIYRKKPAKNMLKIQLKTRKNTHKKNMQLWTLMLESLGKKHLKVDCGVSLHIHPYMIFHYDTPRPVAHCFLCFSPRKSWKPSGKNGPWRLCHVDFFWSNTSPLNNWSCL